jgi:hypothetical protein
MNLIRGKQILNRLIKETIWECPDDNIQFPRTFFFCEGIGQPLFEITIKKSKQDTFVDDEGCIWKKEK